MSAHGRSILVNLSAQEVHLYDLARSVDVLDEKAPPVMCYRGQKQGRYVIRSCFGGRDESFVVSGSEGSQVYVWNRATGELLDVLAGHSGTVNAVAWNPADPYQFASASDDKTVSTCARARARARALAARAARVRIRTVLTVRPCALRALPLATKDSHLVHSRQGDGGHVGERRRGQPVGRGRRVT